MITCERLFGGASSAVLVFTTPQDTVLSLIFVSLAYFGPRHVQELRDLARGKRLGSCRWATAVAPRVIVDTPLIVKALGIG